MEYDCVAIFYSPVLLLIFSAYIKSMGRYLRWFSTSNLIIYYLMSYLISTFIINPSSANGVYWLNIVMLGTTSLLAGCLFASLRNGVTTYSLARKFHDRPIDPNFSNRSQVLIWAIAILSTVVIYVYLKAIQDNILVNIVKDGLNVNTIDVVNMRKKAVYGSGFGSGDYMAAGYVMQFRSFLLPIIMIVCLGYYFLQKEKKNHLILLIILSGVISTFANGAIGERKAFCAPFMICAYMCFIRFYCKPDQLSKKTQTKFKTILIASLVFGFTIFGVLTFALGRNEYSEKKSSNVLSVLRNLGARIFLVPAQKDLLAIDLLREYSPSYGQHYLYGIIKILPNQIEHKIIGNWSEVGTPNWLHFKHGGSKEGNAPLGLWGVLWFNFRLPGVVIGGFIVGFLCQCYDRWGFTRRKTVLSVVCWQFGAISLAFASSVGQILLTGFVAAMILLWLNGLFERGLLANLLPKQVQRNRTFVNG